MFREWPENQKIEDFILIEDSCMKDNMLPADLPMWRRSWEHLNGTLTSASLQLTSMVGDAWEPLQRRKGKKAENGKVLEIEGTCTLFRVSLSLVMTGKAPRVRGVITQLRTRNHEWVRRTCLRYWLDLSFLTCETWGKLPSFGYLICKMD